MYPLLCIGTGDNTKSPKSGLSENLRNIHFLSKFQHFVLIQIISKDFVFTISPNTFMHMCFHFSAARRVADRGEHTVEGQTLQVTLLEPIRHTTSSQGDDDEPFCSIKVTGVSKIESKDTMEYYFENQKRSGGGSIRLLEVNKEEDYAYVTFGNEDGRKESLIHINLIIPPAFMPPGMWV